MARFKTIKGLIKCLKDINNQPLSFLSGYEKLTEDEEYLLGSMMADIGNNLGEDAFVELMKKFKVK